MATPPLPLPVGDWALVCSAESGDLFGGVAAVHHEGLRRDKRCLIGSEEEDRIGDLARLGDALKHVSAAPAGILICGGTIQTCLPALALDDLRPDSAGRNGIDTDMIHCQIEGHAAGHVGDGGLAGIVGDEVRLGDKAGIGGGIDDGSAAARRMCGTTCLATSAGPMT